MLLTAPFLRFNGGRAARWCCPRPAGEVTAGEGTGGGPDAPAGSALWPWAQDLRPGVGQRLGLSASRPGPPPSAGLPWDPCEAGSVCPLDLPWGAGDSLYPGLTSCHGSGGLLEGQRGAGLQAAGPLDAPGLIRSLGGLARTTPAQRASASSPGKRRLMGGGWGPEPVVPRAVCPPGWGLRAASWPSGAVGPTQPWRPLRVPQACQAFDGFPGRVTGSGRQLPGGPAAAGLDTEGPHRVCVWP